MQNFKIYILFLATFSHYRSSSLASATTWIIAVQTIPTKWSRKVPWPDYIAVKEVLTNATIFRKQFVYLMMRTVKS